MRRILVPRTAATPPMPSGEHHVAGNARDSHLYAVRDHFVSREHRRTRVVAVLVAKDVGLHSSPMHGIRDRPPVGGVEDGEAETRGAALEDRSPTRRNVNARQRCDPAHFRGDARDGLSRNAGRRRWCSPLFRPLRLPGVLARTKSTSDGGLRRSIPDDKWNCLSSKLSVQAVGYIERCRPTGTPLVECRGDIERNADKR